MKVNLYDINAQVIGEVTLPSSVFSAPINPRLVAQAIRVYLSNHRRAHAKVKDRGEVSGTTRKMWAQKGTGRARHGSAKAPIFVGGGSAHGPTGKQNFSLKMNQKSRQHALKSVLSQFAVDKAILAVDKITTLPLKTKSAWNFIGELEKANPKLAKSRRIALVLSQSHPHSKRSFRNIPGISIISLQSVNTYDLARQDFLIFTKKAISKLSSL